MLNIIEVAEKFKITQVNYEFNRVEFISYLKDILLDRIKRHPNYCIYVPGTIPYKDFKVLVKDLEVFYKKLSAYRYEKIGKKLTNKLWGVFYGSVIVEYRKENYPHIQDFVETHRKYCYR